MSLNDIEKEGIEVMIRDGEGAEDLGERSLIGKISMDRRIGKEVMRSTIMKV